MAPTGVLVSARCTQPYDSRRLASECEELIESHSGLSVGLRRTVEVRPSCYPYVSVPEPFRDSGNIHTALKRQGSHSVAETVESDPGQPCFANEAPEVPTHNGI